MLLDFLFPRRCLGCGSWGKYFCQNCSKTIKPIEFQICPVCERPAIGGKTHPRCQKKYSLDGFTSVFVYQGIIKQAIAKLKYQFITDLAEDLIELSTECLANNKLYILNHKSAILIPIPLHSRRQRWRGFNQAELLGEMVASNLGLIFLPDLLVRVKNTKPQTKLNEKERRKNIKGAFKINPKTSHFPLHTSNFLIFDDVWTTGSTLRECGRVLKKSGAKMVWGLTLVR